jgi:hypothetical protein
VLEAAQAGPHLLQEDQGEERLSQEQATDVLALSVQNFSHQGKFCIAVAFPADIPVPVAHFGFSVRVIFYANDYFVLLMLRQKWRKITKGS